jgi:hypothetical protein
MGVKLFTHGSFGNDWEIIEKYLNGQDTHHAREEIFQYYSSGPNKD